MYHVLIADDEEAIRGGLKCLFDWESLGFSIIGEAANGDQAYEAILKLQPDVVLMDIRMPGMTGLEVIRRAREQGFSGKVIILSGFSDFKYAQDAIRFGVEDYLTKPVDDDELLHILCSIREELDLTHTAIGTVNHYRQKAHDAILKDILTGNANLALLNRSELHLDADVYQVVIYEKYSHNAQDASYSFSDLLRVTNQDNNSFDCITLQYNEVLLLKGAFAIRKFNEFLDRYQRENPPQKDSPLDTLFITYGKCVHTLQEIPDSYADAHRLIMRRFFCDQAQHTIGYDDLPAFGNTVPVINDLLLNEYADKLQNYIQTFNRSMVAEILKDLQTTLYNASDSIDTIKLFLADLYLLIKERIRHLYHNIDIPFPGNASVIRFIEEKYYLYEILLFFTEQFEIIMSAIGNSSRDSVLDDILHYIDHNYASSITLENIAPLFGYNSSYLGKIFSKKMGMNFNAYVDHIRIEQSKKLLLNDDMKVYHVAEMVGYRNVDYFHIKFKKYVGQSPAEFRKKYKNSLALAPAP
jgi:two-component system response regulator YesN